MKFLLTKEIHFLVFCSARHTVNHLSQETETFPADFFFYFFQKLKQIISALSTIKKKNHHVLLQ